MKMWNQTIHHTVKVAVKLLTNNVFQALQIEGNVSGRKPLFLGCEGHDSYLQMI